MSHARGEIIIGGRVAAHYEYNGTSDVAQPKLYATYEELDADWREGEWVTCTCGQPSTPCVIWTDYGGGFYWDGAVCMTCRCITDGLSPFGLSGSWGHGWTVEPRECTDGYPLKEQVTI